MFLVKDNYKERKNRITGFLKTEGAQPVSTGMYLYRITGGEFIIMKKIVFSFRNKEVPPIRKLD